VLVSQSLPDFIDNEDLKLAEILDLLLRKESRADIASGYFNLSGFALVREALKGAPRIRLLLSKEQGAGGELYPTGFRQDLTRTPFQAETRALAEELIAFLKRPEVEVRLYTKGFFHGKAYIFDHVAIVGSSNFTRAGLTANTELNAVLKQGYAAEAVREWFERFWGVSEDYKHELIALLEESKLVSTGYSPYLIFLKSLYEYFKDELVVDLEKGRELGKSLVNLADFQEKAFERALRILEKYDGVFIADSVGLGKTWVGKKILEHFGYFQRKKVLVVAPAQLVEMWRRELGSINVAAEVLSMELLGRSEFDPSRYFDVDVVLVDESHNFRNLNQRYFNLQRIMAAGKRKKGIFLTATPINNSVFDLYNQVMLFAKSERSFTRAGIPHLRTYFIQAQRGGDLLNLLEEIMIRRTRQFIKREFPEAEIDGQTIRFPRRVLHTVHYDLEARYPGIYREVARHLERLALAVYNLEAYLRSPTAEDRLEQQRNEALIGLIKSLFLKRFESSVEAFRKSLERQIAYHKRFIKELEEHDRLLASADFRKLLATESEEEAALEDLPKVGGSDYQKEKLLSDANRDLKILEQLLHLIKPIDIPGDAKIQRLIELIRERAGKKIVIFSHFQDTVRYLERAFREFYPSELGNRRWAVVDGSVPPKERAKLIERFAPKAQNVEVSPEDELDLLLSTDVLSEGQNLQDADTLINFDLHWNPTRMVQRAGRIDRLRSPYDEVHIYNFFPEKGLEELLGLLRKLMEKIEQINRNVGLDASILGEVVDPKTFNALRRIEAEDPKIADELEAEAELSSEFMRAVLATFLERVGVERLEAIPYGVHSGKAAEARRGVFFHFKAKGQHLWRFYDVESGEILDSKLQIFNLIRCDENTLRVDADYDIDQILAEVKASLLKDLNAQHAAMLEELPKVQRDVLNTLRGFAYHPEIERELIVYLLKALGSPLPRALLRELNTLFSQNRHDDFHLVNVLKAFVERYGLSESMSQFQAVEQFSEKDLELVVFLTLS